MKNTDYQPDYAVDPLETVKDMALQKLIGTARYRELERRGITDVDARKLGVVFEIDPDFFLTLQENYDHTVARLMQQKKGEDPCYGQYKS